MPQKFHGPPLFVNLFRTFRVDLNELIQIVHSWVNLEGREVDVNSIVFVFVVCLFSRVVSKGRREEGEERWGERILMENGKYLTLMRYFTASVKFLNLRQNGLIACEISFPRSWLFKI